MPKTERINTVTCLIDRNLKKTNVLPKEGCRYTFNTLGLKLL